MFTGIEDYNGFCRLTEWKSMLNLINIEPSRSVVVSQEDNLGEE